MESRGKKQVGCRLFNLKQAGSEFHMRRIERFTKPEGKSIFII